MQKLRFRSLGMTLAECLVAVTMLAICAGPLLAAVLTAQTRTTEAQERLVVLQQVLGEMERQRGFAHQGTLAPLDLERQYDLPLVSTPLFVRVQVSLVTGYTNLYIVTVTGTWDRSLTPVVLTTRLRSPDA